MFWGGNTIQLITESDLESWVGPALTANQLTLLPPQGTKFYGPPPPLQYSTIDMFQLLYSHGFNNFVPPTNCSAFSESHIQNQ